MLSRISPVLYTKGSFTALIGLVLALMPQVVHAQKIECHFTEPVRVLGSASELPPAIHDALIKDDMIVDRVTSTAGPFFIHAGQFKDLYFVWSSRGDRLATEFISLYRTEQNGGEPTLLTRVTGPFAGPDWARWCKRTADLLDVQREPVVPPQAPQLPQLKF
jgi:hypothetical protein